MDKVNIQEDAFFEMLYKKYWSLLLNFAHNFIDDKEACKEIVQELFVSLHYKRTKIHIHASLSSYLYTSIKHKAMNHIRDESVYKKHVTNAGKTWCTVTGHNNVEQNMNIYDLEKEICYCLNRMPLKYREVYVLSKQHAFTLKRIADILQRPVDTVEKQLRKATRQIKEHLNRYYLI